MGCPTFWLTHLFSFALKLQKLQKTMCGFDSETKTTTDTEGSRN
jgi:hypothetical protein